MAAGRTDHDDGSEDALSGIARLWVLVLLASLVLLAATGCGGGGDGQAVSGPPTYEFSEGDMKYTLRDNVVQLPDDGSVDIKEVTEECVTLGPGGPDVKSGDVVVSTEGQGLLRRVTSVAAQGNDLVLSTEQGTLEDLFLHADIHWSGEAQGYDLVVPEDGVEVLNGTPTPVPAGLVDADATFGFKVNVAKVDLKLSRKWALHPNVDLDIRGKLSVGVPVEVKLHADWCKLEELSFMMGIDAKADLKAELSGTARTDIVDESIPIGYLVGSPIPAGPLVFVPVTQICLRYKETFEASASLEAGIEFTPRLMMGAQWLPESGWQARFASSSASEMGSWLKPYFNLKGEAKTTTRLAAPEFEGALRLYGLAGLYGKLSTGWEGTASGEYTFAGTDAGQLKVKLDSYLFAEAQPGAQVKVVGWDLADWKMPFKWEERVHLPGFPKEFTKEPADPDPVDDDEYIIGGGIAPDPDNPNDILITLNAIVSRDDGTPITGLTKANFQVYEDGRWRVVKDVQETSATSSATDMCFCLDVSGSMSPERQGIIDSIESFVDQLAPLDVHLAGVTFRYDESNPDATLDFVDANTNLDAFKQFLAGVHIWDTASVDTADENGAMAVAYAWNRFSWRPAAQKLFVLITDEYCQPGGSGYGLSAVADLIRGKAAVHAIRDAEDTGYGGFDARELAAATGGTSYDLPESGYVDLTQLPLSGVVLSGYVVRFSTQQTHTSHQVHLICYMGGRAVADQMFSGTW